MDNNLKDFRFHLQKFMDDSLLRPFVCDGSPFNCKVFIVGFNPATSIGKPFWQYWSDELGFNKVAFMQEYLKVRELKGVRPRIEKIVSELPKGVCLETNICSKPTKTAIELGLTDRRTNIFQFLLETIKPKVVYVHSNDPVLFFQRLTGCNDFTSGRPQLVEWKGNSFYLLGTKGPLFRMGFAEATSIGQILAEYLKK